MKKKRRLNFLRDSFKIFIKSFKKINIHLLFVIIMDLLFFVFIFIASLIANKILTKQALKLQSLPMDTLSLEVDQAQDILKSVSNFVVGMLITIGLLMIFIILNWSFFKYLIWNLVVNGKIQLKNFWKFLLANIVWFFIWLVPFVLTFYPLFLMVKLGQLQKPPLFPIIAMSIVLCAALHFTYLYYIGFIKENHIGKAIAFAFKTGTVKIKFLLLPYLFVFVSFAIISSIIYPVKFLPDKASFLISLIVFVVYVGWLRFYISSVVQTT